MSDKTFAIITDIHSNVYSLEKALSIIADRPNIDQLICLGDCFALGPDPEKTLQILSNLPDCIFIRGNHDRYLLERIWEQERPSLEDMDPDDPICQAIVQNEKWTAEKVGDPGVEFVRKMKVAHREIVGTTLVEFTHAWYQRDDHPPSIQEALNWRDYVTNTHQEIERFIFVHGHVHIPRNESKENLTILCQGATGLPFDEDPRGSVAFLTINDDIKWDVVRFDYDNSIVIDRLEERQIPFYKHLRQTVKYGAIQNNI